MANDAVEIPLSGASVATGRGRWLARCRHRGLARESSGTCIRPRTLDKLLSLSLYRGFIRVTQATVVGLQTKSCFLRIFDFSGAQQQSVSNHF